MFQFRITLVLIALAILHKNSKAQGDSLNVNEIVEFAGNLFVTEDFNPEWERKAGLNENTTWYFPFMSKLRAYRLSKSLYQAPGFENITESQLVNSCITLQKKANGLHMALNGYDGKKVVKSLVPVYAKVFRYGVGAQANIVLSDNESYNLLDISYDDGTRAFALESIKKSVDEGTLNIVKAHLKSLGFKEKDFLSTNYADCVEKDGVLTTKGDDLPKPAKEILLPALLVPLAGPKYVVLPGYKK